MASLPKTRHPFIEISLLLFLPLAFLAGCGRKLAPEPPLQVLPARVEPVRLSQEGSDVVLRFPYPSKTNAGETLTNLTGVTVYRELVGAREGERPPEGAKDAATRERDEKGFRARAEAIQKLTRAELDADTVGADVVVRDPLAPFFREGRIGRMFLRYGVTATRDKKKASELSPLVALLPRVPPDRPFHVVPTVEEARVCLDWSAPFAMLDGTRPAKVAGYAVYRRDAVDEEYEDRPLGIALGATTYVDTTVVPDRKYFYTVRAAPVAEMPLILGPASDEVPVSTADVFSPDAPDGVLILAEAGGTRLVWNPSLAGDLASYRVYRREKGAWKRIAEDLKNPVYFDADVPAAEYGVTAVDKAGNESAIGTAK
ncbi:MAG: fibronectin type III domain-containing protein [Thermoanaerobaculia bacterium]